MATEFPGQYQRRRPEETVLYGVIQESYRSFVALCEDEGRSLLCWAELMKRVFDHTTNYM